MNKKSVISYLKSLIQKAIRRKYGEIALKGIVSLYQIDKQSLIRRLPLILLEDVGVIRDEDNVFFDLIQQSRCGKDILDNQIIINKLAKIVYSDKRNYPFYWKYFNGNDSGLYDIDLDKVEYPDLFRRAIKYRIKIGGLMAGDKIMSFAYLKDYDKLTKISFPEVKNSFSISYQLTLDDMMKVPYAVDQHSSPIVKIFGDRFKKKYDLDLGRVIWCLEGGVNDRVCAETGETYNWQKHFQIDDDKWQRMKSSLQECGYFTMFRSEYIRQIYDKYMECLANINNDGIDNNKASCRQQELFS